jgi:hypothetical protein
MLVPLASPALKLVLMLATAQAASSPNPIADTPHAYLMVRCTNSNKSGQYKDVMMASTAKSMQVRADEGDIAGWIFAQAVIPSGAASTCDFMQMNLYRRFPPQRTPVDPYFVKAGVKMTRDEWYAKLGEVSRLMRIELWRGLHELGRPEKGQFLRIDYLKVPPERRAEWAQKEEGQWKPLQAAKIKEGALSGWQVQELLLPSGSGEPYNARALTVFPSWDALGNPVGVAEVALAGKASATRLRDVVRSELYEIIAVVRPGAPAVATPASMPAATPAPAAPAATPPAK